jgi:SAM-dependent methyltransferase
MSEVWLPRIVEGAARSENGIVRLLAPSRRDAVARFVEQYRLVREREGYRRRDAEFYRRLPDVAHDDPHHDEWHVRRQSLRHVERQLAEVLGPGMRRLLDLGAGNGWLSHRFAAQGHLVVAVDLLDDEADGLGACRHYATPFAAVQADFDALPFEPRQFDVVILGGSLHYSPAPSATLREAARMLTGSGVLVVMDSPMFTRRGDGEQMVASVRRQFSDQHGLATPVTPGVGFLTFTEMADAFASLGMRSRFFPSHGPLRWRLRRPVARMRLGRAPAAFGAWIAR